jgi:hypothetical protein
MQRPDSQNKRYSIPESKPQLLVDKQKVGIMYAGLINNRSIAVGSLGHCDVRGPAEEERYNLARPPSDCTQQPPSPAP